MVFSLPIFFNPSFYYGFEWTVCIPCHKKGCPKYDSKQHLIEASDAVYYPTKDSLLSYFSKFREYGVLFHKI